MEPRKLVLEFAQDGAASRRMTRPKRVPTPPVDVHVCDAYARLVNISAAGALMRTDALLLDGRECPFTLKCGKDLVHLKVRVVRTTLVADEDPELLAVEHEDYLLAVRFTHFTSSGRDVVA